MRNQVLSDGFRALERMPVCPKCMSSLGLFLGIQDETWFLQMLSLRSSRELLVDLQSRRNTLRNEVLFFPTPSKVMTSGFNAQAFKYFSLKNARDHPEYPPAQWLGNSSGSSGVTPFLCFWFWGEIHPEAGSWKNIIKSYCDKQHPNIVMKKGHGKF